MKRRSWLKILRDVGFIGVMFLALDFTISQFLPPELLDPSMRARAIDKEVYDYTVRYNHGLRPNLGPMQRLFGSLRYTFQTDRFGFRTGECAGNDPVTQATSSVFVLGDSFTEGVGLAFEKTFAGLMACEWKKHGLTVWNLGVVSHSPSLYYYHLLDAVRETSIVPKEIFVFLDLSDIPDEALNYEEKDGRIVWVRRYYTAFDPHIMGVSVNRVREFLQHNFMSAALEMTIHDMLRQRKGARLNASRSHWTVSAEAMKEFGEKGLAKAAMYMDRIVDECRAWNCKLTLIVYPWPDQIAYDSDDSIQVRYWKRWAQTRSARFIDGFASFFAEPQKEVLAKYFIPGDVHFSAAGHRLLFEAVSRSVWSGNTPAESGPKSTKNNKPE